MNQEWVFQVLLVVGAIVGIAIIIAAKVMGIRIPDESRAEAIANGLLSQILNVPAGRIQVWIWRGRGVRQNKAILFCHGFSQLQPNCLDAMDMFSRNGYDVYSFSSPNASLLQPIVPERILSEDIMSLYEFVRRDFAPEDIIILGHSFGGSATVRLAVDERPRVLILASCPSSMSAALLRNPATVPYSGLARSSHRVDELVSALTDTNLVVLQGGKDKAFTRSDARRIISSYRGRGRSELVYIDDAAHDTIFEQSSNQLLELIENLS